MGSSIFKIEVQGFMWCISGWGGDPHQGFDGESGIGEIGMGECGGSYILNAVS